MDPIVVHLIAHEFRPLFIERLGWDRAHEITTAIVDGIRFSLETIAHKRGFQIIHCSADPYTMFNRARLRAIQKQVLRVAHEHVVIYSCDDPARQVWQWAIRVPDGRRVRHREHPFFSSTPPDALVSRLRGLRFTLAEEEHVTLLDALDRIRHALDTHAEPGLLVTRVGYAEQSDRLARAMKEGGAAALHAFALFHRPLARSGARHMRRWFGLDEDEAEQIGMVAVLRAAKWFKPELGFQFSTYATPVIRRQCESDGPVEHLTIGMPATVYWRHARLAQRLDSLDARFGTGSAERCARWMAQRDSRFGEQWDRAARAIGVRSLSDRRSPAYRAALQLVAPQDQRSTETEYLIECLLAAVDRLPPGDAMIIRWRYGFEGTPLTLERVGEIIGRTRERVRQRQNESEKFIRAFVLAKLGVRDGGSSEGLESIDVADARLDATEAAATGQRIDETDDDADTQTAKGRTHRRPSRGIVHPHAV